MRADRGKANEAVRILREHFRYDRVPSTQHSDLISVIQRNGGQLPALLVALREKNASNGIIQ